MGQPVEIENDALKIEVWPQFGGKIASVIDKADGYDLLFEYPAELPTGPRYGGNYGDGWYGGWDECFPAVAKGVYPRHPYKGIEVPDHGELWGIPTTAVPAKEGITTVWHGLRFGYRLTRRVTLEGGSVAARYTLVNLGPYEFPFVWAQHALMGMGGEGVVIEGLSGAWRLTHEVTVGDVDREFEWPDVEAGANLARPQSATEGRGWKAFSAGRIVAPVTVRYPGRRRQLMMEYSSSGDDVGAYWGVWVNTGGWSKQRHFAIEPTTGRHDSVERALRDGSAGTVGALAKVEWEVRWTVGKG